MMLPVIREKPRVKDWFIAWRSIAWLTARRWGTPAHRVETRPGAAASPWPGCHGQSLFAVDVSDVLLGLTFELEDVQAGVRAVDDVDAPAIVGRDVVRLDHLPADVRVALVGPAPEVGVRRHGGDEERYVVRVVRIADVECAHAGVEVRHEDELLVERRPELLIGRVRAETAALIAEGTFRRGRLRRGDHLRPTRHARHARTIADVGQERQVTELG